jgi:hypothetical protein
MHRKRKFLIYLSIFLSAFLSLPACGNGGQEVESVGTTSTSTVRDSSESEAIQVELIAQQTFDPCSDILALHQGTGSPDRQHWFNHLTYQDYARYWIACVHHWGEAEWQCMVALYNHESGWNPTIWNKGGSGAYGIPQALPGDKMASHGADWRTNGRTQLRWASRYIDDRYGAPSKINGGRCRGPY